MTLSLKQIANTLSRISKESKAHAIMASPLVTITVICIKSNEIIDDVLALYDGKVYKTARSVRPTK